MLNIDKIGQVGRNIRSVQAIAVKNKITTPKDKEIELLLEALETVNLSKYESFRASCGKPLNQSITWDDLLEHLDWLSQLQQADVNRALGSSI